MKILVKPPAFTLAKQKILIIITPEPNLRCSADGWDWEDGNLVSLDKEIGLSGSGHCPTYQTPLHAIGDGWRLLAPPLKIGDGYEWWLEK